MLRRTLQGARSLSGSFRPVDAVVGEWIGWSWAPAEQVIAESGWQPDGSDAYCNRCGESVGPGEATEGGCTACRGRRLPFRRFIRLGRYEDPLRTWVSDAKYRSWVEVQVALGRRLGHAILGAVDVTSSETARSGATRARPKWPSAESLIVPVPMPLPRRIFRGVDHARVIADAVASVLRIDVTPILAKANGIPQAVLSATERRRGRSKWIRPRRGIGGKSLDGLDIILIDDVRTTGTTLKVAATVLRGLGARTITCAVLAVADAPGRRAPASSE